MANELSNLKPRAGATRARTRVGRGEASGLGKTSGRGMKGQGARNNVKPGFEGGQVPLYRRLPKRGFNNIFGVEYTEVRLDLIARHFKPGEVVDVDSLRERGLVKSVSSHGVKVLGNGEISFALTVKAARFTASAAEKIQQAGGTAEVV